MFKLVNDVPENAGCGKACIATSYVFFDHQMSKHLQLIDGGKLVTRDGIQVETIVYP